MGCFWCIKRSKLKLKTESNTERIRCVNVYYASKENANYQHFKSFT